VPYGSAVQRLETVRPERVQARNQNHLPR